MLNKKLAHIIHHHGYILALQKYIYNENFHYENASKCQDFETQ